MTLELIFWDVQHGNAIYAKTPNRKNIVIDLGVGSFGGNSSTFSPLMHLREKYNVKELDYVIITHPHKDHIADILNFDKLSPKVLTRPKKICKEDIMKDVKDEDKPIFEKYLEISERYSQSIKSDRDPEKQENNGGVVIKTFVPKGAYSNPNDYSIVTTLAYADSKMIIPGDNGAESWKELLEMKDFKKEIEDVDIFVAPHHGRESGYYPELFKYFKPSLAIISDGGYRDTSATDRYSGVCKGWGVHHRGRQGNEERKCLTTRKDGVIVVKFGYNEGKRPFIFVEVD